MTHIFHLGFLGRKANQFGDTITFTDGLPPPTEEELADSYDAALEEWRMHKEYAETMWTDLKGIV